MMNDAASAAFQVAAIERTKQSEQETLQEKERTRQSVSRTISIVGACVVTGVMLAVAPAAAWAVAAIVGAMMAPQAFIGILERTRDLIAEKKRPSLDVSKLLTGEKERKP